MNLTIGSMINFNRVWYLLGLVAIPYLARWWGRFKVARREKARAALPLFSLVELEVACTPHDPGDNSDVLAELRHTLAFLNRRTFANEVWELDKQLATYYARLPLDCKPTMRRVMLRLIDSNDKWLQLISARTSAGLDFAEAAVHVKQLLDAPGTADGTKVSADDAASSAKFKAELGAALERLQRSAEPNQHA